MAVSELLFFAVWLLGWTLGVSVIQTMAIAEGFSSPVALFLFTHGGAEIIVLSLLANRLYNAAGQPTQQPELQRDHAGLTARWTAGSSQSIVAFVGAILGIIVHAALFSTVFAGLAGATSLWSPVLALLTFGAWCFTGWKWSQALYQHVKARAEVALDADLDRVRITTEGPAGTQTTEIPLAGLLIEDQLYDLELLGADGAHWSGLCAPGTVRDEMVAAIRTMAERAVPAEPVEEPDQLKALRGERVTE